MPASTLIINRGDSESDCVSHGARKEQSTSRKQEQQGQTERSCYSNPSELGAIDIYKHLTTEILEVPKRPQNKSNSSKSPGT